MEEIHIYFHENVSSVSLNRNLFEISRLLQNSVEIQVDRSLFHVRQNEKVQRGIVFVSEMFVNPFQQISRMLFHKNILFTNVDTTTQPLWRRMELNSIFLSRFFMTIRKRDADGKCIA